MKECECESPSALLRLRILSQLRILIYNYEFWWCFRRWWTSCRALSLSTEETGATKKYMRKITQQQHNSNNQKATICYCYSLDNNNQLRSGQRVRERVDAKFGFQFQLIFFFFYSGVETLEMPLGKETRNKRTSSWKYQNELKERIAREEE